MKSTNGSKSREQKQNSFAAGVFPTLGNWRYPQDRPLFTTPAASLITVNKYALSSAQLNAMEQKPVVSTKDWQFYESTILKSRDNLGKILKEYKESETWKDHYKSWAAACVPFSVSKRWANELIQTEQGGGPPTLANKAKKKEEAALTQVEAARTEEPETPAVHSADEAKEPEAPKTRSGTKTNGIEKSKHPLWKELTETYGRLMRRADELNKVCPNTGQHGLLIQQTKVCMTTVDQWRESVR